MADTNLDLDALLTLGYGLYIVSSCKDGRLNGQISNAVMQVTDTPPRLVTAINKGALTYEFIRHSGVFAVTVLAESAPMKMIGLFGFKSGRAVDKFSQVSYETGPTGCGIVRDHALACAEVEVETTVDCGTHAVLLGRVVAGQIIGTGRAMTYAYYREVLGGKTPPTAPTYRASGSTRPPDQRKDTSNMGKYVCDVCGYVFDPVIGDEGNGIAPGTSFGDLPDDWVCPDCGAGKEDFSPVG